MREEVGPALLIAFIVMFLVSFYGNHLGGLLAVQAIEPKHV
jgi:hypothetical protein